MFVVFEGADFTGKTTLARSVAKRVVELGYSLDKINLTFEPSDSVVGQRIRHLLQEGDSQEEMPDLFIQDRKTHVEREILPTLREEGLVLCDRYKYSTICYQSLQGHDIYKLIELNRDFPVPDITFILLLQDEKEVIRRSQRETEKECFDNLSWFYKAQKVYYTLPKLLPEENFLFLDAHWSMSALTDLVLLILDSIKRKMASIL